MQGTDLDTRLGTINDTISGIQDDVSDLQEGRVVSDFFAVNMDAFTPTSGETCLSEFTVAEGDTIDFSANFSLGSFIMPPGGWFWAELRETVDGTPEVRARAEDDRGLPATVDASNQNNSLTLLYRNEVPSLGGTF